MSRIPLVANTIMNVSETMHSANEDNNDLLWCEVPINAFTRQLIILSTQSIFSGKNYLKLKDFL